MREVRNGAVTLVSVWNSVRIFGFKLQAALNWQYRLEIAGKTAVMSQQRAYGLSYDQVNPVQ
jgi:hypothetical protein